MPAFEGLINLLGALNSDKITIHEERCISVRNRNADCLRCAAACTSEAIVYGDNNLTINQENCIGCGTCATSCPTSAIEVNTPNDEQLTKRLKQVIVATGGHPVIACTELLDRLEAEGGTKGSLLKHAVLPFDPAQICEVRCLGRIDESSLVGLAAYKSYDTTLACDHCETCEHAPGGCMIRTVIESAENLIAAFGSTMPIKLQEGLPERVAVQTETGAVSGEERRDLFESAAAKGKSVAVDAIDSALPGNTVEEIGAAYRKVNKDGTLSHFTPSRRIRVFNYLKHIGSPVAPTIESRIIGEVHIDTDACNSCRMCAVFCPTGALEKNDAEGAWGIFHRPAKCMQCRLCESICTQNAIEVQSVVDADRFMGKQALFFKMEQPSWTPNRPDSLYNKFHSVIGEDCPMTSF